MRFTITPLGAAGGRSVDQVVGDIVRYLDRPRPVPKSTEPVDKGVDPASSYYADGSAEPGRWLGRGARSADLVGRVDPDDFAKVLAGRDPKTGARLLDARGSAGRRPTLGVGAETRWAGDGEALYDEHDAAAALGVEADELDRLLAAGARVAVSALVASLTGTKPPHPGPANAYLVPIIDPAGGRWVRDSELTRLEHARAAGPSAEDISAAGKPDDQIPLAEASRLAGLTARYLRGLASRYERDREEIDRALAQGKPVRRAYLVAYRGTRRQWLVRRADLADFVTRRTAPAVRVGFDLTLTTEKSLGVLALLGPDHVRDVVLAAIQAGNDTGLQAWERASAVARVGGELVPAAGWTLASFRHLTSRALDPFPHHHNVVANSVVTETGERRTLDSKSLYRHAVAASALATAEMRSRLTAELGVRWRRSAHGGWEIDGIPQDVLREFSKRRTEIDDALAELEEAIGRTTTIGELQDVVTSTRPPKEQADPADLRADWWQRAQTLGFAPDDLAGCVGRRGPGPDEDDVDRDAVFSELAGRRGICAGGSVFTRADALAALVDAPVTQRDGGHQPLLVSAAQLEELADEFLSSSHVVRLEPAEDAPRVRGLRDEPLYSTVEMLRAQQRIIDRYRHSIRNRHGARVEHTTPALNPTGQLSDEQRALMRSFCTSGLPIQCAVGRAGSGKTTAMAAAARAWEADGFRVVGAAVKGEAARLLGTSAGIPAETLAWYLAQDDPRNSPLDNRTVLIVDEASTVSDRDLDKLLHLATAAGATVRLIGDPAQHGAVTAGGMFRVLCEAHPGLTPQLTENRRLQHPSDRTAVDALRDGRVEEALEALRSAGHLHLAADDVQLYARLLTRWWNGRQEGAPHPLVERSNRRRRQLNRLARRLLQAHGDLPTDELDASGGRAFAIGDEVLARRGNRDRHPPDEPHAYLRNGSRGVITAIHRGTRPERDTLVADFDGLGSIEIPRAFFDDHAGRNGRVDAGIDHAYAVTSYAVQGATFEESTGRVDEHTTRAETYVDVTRGRRANHLFVTRAEDPLDGERLPKAPPPPLDVSLTIRLRASAGEVTAWELDPHALGRTQDSPDPAPPLAVSP